MFTFWLGLDVLLGGGADGDVAGAECAGQLGADGTELSKDVYWHHARVSGERLFRRAGESIGAVSDFGVLAALAPIPQS